jgi:hypothetical protein
MTVLIRVVGPEGERRCDARCHRASPVTRGKSKCVCGGTFRGVERNGRTALDVPSARVEWVREHVLLKLGEYVQLRTGA